MYIIVFAISNVCRSHIVLLVFIYLLFTNWNQLSPLNEYHCTIATKNDTISVYIGPDNHIA